METYLGQIIMFAGDFVPEGGWLRCEGQLLKQQDYPELFEAIGNTYGGNDTHFNLPDLKGRFPMSSGPAFMTGHMGGGKELTLKPEHIPLHTHYTKLDDNAQIEFSANDIGHLLPVVASDAASATLANGGQTTPVGNVLARAASGVSIAHQVYTSTSPPAQVTTYLGGVSGGFTKGSKVRGNVTLKPVGGTPVPLLPPSLGIHFLIATRGVPA